MRLPSGSAQLQRGKLMVNLDDEESFLCGDEINLIIDGVKHLVSPEDVYPRGLVSRVNICHQHNFQIEVLQHTFPTQSSTSLMFKYMPQGNNWHVWLFSLWKLMFFLDNLLQKRDLIV